MLRYANGPHVSWCTISGDGGAALCGYTSRAASHPLPPAPGNSHPPIRSRYAGVWPIRQQDVVTGRVISWNSSAQLPYWPTFIGSHKQRDTRATATPSGWRCYCSEQRRNMILWYGKQAFLRVTYCMKPHRYLTFVCLLMTVCAHACFKTFWLKKKILPPAGSVSLR